MTPRALTSPGFSTSLLLAALFAAWMGPAHAQSLPGEGNSCLPDLGNGKTCTANDLRLQAQVVSAPLSCELGDTISVTFRTSIGSTAASRAAGERYSLGFFIGENGGAAIDPGAGETCTVSYLTPNTGSINLTSGVGPYRELSPSADQCGDIQDADTTFHDITSSQILCRDNDGDGRVDISAAVTWESNKSRTCASPPTVADFGPNQSSKCLSSVNFGLDIPVETPPAISVSKTAIPDVI